MPTALLAAAVSLWVASQASAEAFQMLGLILLAGTVLYFIAGRGRGQPRPGLTPPARGDQRH